MHASLFWKEIRIIRRLPSLDAWATLPRISPKMRVCLKTIYFWYNYSNYSNFFPKKLFIPSHFFRWIRQYLHSVVCAIRSKVKSQRLTIRNELFTIPFSLFTFHSPPWGSRRGASPLRGWGWCFFFLCLSWTFPLVLLKRRALNEMIASLRHRNAEGSLSKRRAFGN